MDKLKMHTPNLVDGNIAKIAALFPNAVTEVRENGETKLAIDFDVLRQELSEDVVEGAQERYQFTWPDKKKSVVLANQPIAKTLRLDREKSVGRDGTPGGIDSENIYIEGDNLDALKLLQETYLGKVKMIYIDPPYNTGSDVFVYDDDSSISGIEFSEISGQRDDNGNLLFDIRPNNEANGRFHTDWLNMLYPRLRIAKDLMSDDGVIFISIDDNELHNLIKICDEIFGESNFVGTISRATGTTTGQDANKIGSSLDYCVVYSKSSLFSLKGIDMDEKDMKRFSESDSKGRYSTLQLRKTGNADRKEDRPNMFFPVIAPDGSEVYPFGPGNYLSRWRVAKDSYDKLVQDDMIVWKENTDEEVEVDGYKKSKWTPYVKYYLEGRTKQVSNLFQDIEGNKKASIVLKDLLGSKGVFDNPKPVEFMYRLIQIATDEDSIVMDFFSGSGTTAHALIQYNQERSCNLKFILVQLPEQCDVSTEANKMGFKTICDIGEERIRRAGKKIVEESPLTAGDLDIGFRVFKVDTTNMEDVYYKPADYDQGQMHLFADNIKPDRSPEDLLFQVMLDLGILLSSKIEEAEIAGKKVFSVADGYLIACFDSDVTEETVKDIAKRHPFYAVFRDSGMATDSVATNFEQIFETYSPKTQRKVL